MNRFHATSEDDGAEKLDLAALEEGGEPLARISEKDKERNFHISFHRRHLTLRTEARAE